MDQMCNNKSMSVMSPPEVQRISPLPTWVAEAVDKTQENLNNYDQFIKGKVSAERPEHGVNQVFDWAMVLFDEVTLGTVEYLRKYCFDERKRKTLLPIVEAGLALSEICKAFGDGTLQLAEDSQKNRVMAARGDCQEWFLVPSRVSQYREIALAIRPKRAVNTSRTDYGSHHDFENNEHRAQPRLMLSIKKDDYSKPIAFRIDLDKARVPGQGRGITFDLIVGGEDVDVLANEGSNIKIPSRRDGHHFDCGAIKGGMDKSYFFSEMLEVMLDRARGVV